MKILRRLGVAPGTLGIKRSLHRDLSAHRAHRRLVVTIPPFRSRQGHPPPPSAVSPPRHPPGYPAGRPGAGAAWRGPRSVTAVSGNSESSSVRLRVKDAPMLCSPALSGSVNIDAVFRQEPRFDARSLVDVHRDPIGGVIRRVITEDAPAARIQRQVVAGAAVCVSVLTNRRFGRNRRARAHAGSDAA